MSKYLPKTALVDQEYYKGYCKNATVAVWDADNQRFWYVSHKWDTPFYEAVQHASDDNGFDLFYPEEPVKPAPDQEVDLEMVKKEVF